MVLLLFLLIISALISAFETAYFSLIPDKQKYMEEGKEPGNRRLSKLIQEPEKTSATILVANTLINVAIIILAVHFIHVAVGDPSQGALLFLQVICSALVLLLFGEVIPRKYASGNVIKVARRTAGIIWVMQKIGYPLVYLFVLSNTFINKHTHKKQSISLDDLSNALENTSEVIPENENILKGIVKFGNIDAHTIMTPRMDVESIDVSIHLPELLAVINESGYSRIPVYDDTPDNIIGILYVKDLLPYIEEADDFKWQKLIRDAYFVPENKKIDDLLKKFQETKIHMAVIIDEYGGMVGIVTLEDVLEEIVGDIADESDDDELGYEQIDPNTYLFDGKVLLNDFYRIMHLDDTIFNDIRGEADTLAGLILELKAEIPAEGACVDYKNLSFCVESVENRRIRQLRVIVNEPENSK